MKKILLIEDNNEIRENVTELLELEGYAVITASNGRIGFELAKKELPDIILSDIMMPEMNGHEVYAALKLDNLTKQIPFIFLTSSSEKKQVQAALDKGVDAYLQKPFEAQDMFDAVSRCLAGNINTYPPR
jgi:CheY-like chemotaxis protein